MEITLSVPDSVGAKIQALSILTNKQGTELSAQFASQFEAYLSAEIIRVCGGVPAPQFTTTGFQQANAHVNGAQFADGIAEGTGESEDRFDDDGIDTMPPMVNEAAEVQRALASVQQAAPPATAPAGDMMDDIQNELENGQLESVPEEFELDEEDPDERRRATPPAPAPAPRAPARGRGRVGRAIVTPLSSQGDQAPEDYDENVQPSTENLMTDGGQADFFMSALEGRSVRTGIGKQIVSQAKRARVSPAK